MQPAQNTVQYKESFISGMVKLFFYPFYFLIANIFNPRNGIFKKTFSLLFSFFVLFPIWLLEIGAATLALWFVLQYVGLAYVRVPVQGASMLPTLPTLGAVEFKRYPTIEQFKPTIQRGDLVVFENNKTREVLQKEGKDSTGFVKRVVAVAGDRVVLKDGFVYVNDQMVEEPYILKPRSTFGGDTIQDCKETIVPTGSAFVLGDNRKASMDSRQLGLISINDVEFYRSFNDQKQFTSKWRDASHDKDIALSSIFDINEYLNLLNKERVKAGLQPLKHQPKLDQSAKLRAEVMLQYDDLSFESKKSQYPMEKALKDVGYSNIVYGEFPIIGYYDAKELYDSFFEYQHTKEFLLNKDYQEIGVSTFVGDLHGCPVQIVVQHLAGYIPPNYEKDVVQSWKELVTRLGDVKPSWEKLKNNDEFYKAHKEDVDKINEIINTRLSHAEAIAKRMEANEWLTEEEKGYMEQDETLHNQQNELAEKLNGAINQ